MVNEVKNLKVKDVVLYNFVLKLPSHRYAGSVKNSIECGKLFSTLQEMQ